MKINEVIGRIMPQTIKPMGLVHKPGTGPNNRFGFRNHSNNRANENFADGKKKGKSRPGRVKRSGASCKGSVTSLRAKAKKYGGEKGKMYHWCANMKGGKKKSEAAGVGIVTKQNTTKDVNGGTLNKMLRNLHLIK
tara:strand:- start:25 stop:432 length:408 start_codon:yes stop_codon:yes gene_type:complete